MYLHPLPVKFRLHGKRFRPRPLGHFLRRVLPPGQLRYNYSFPALDIVLLQNCISIGQRLARFPQISFTRVRLVRLRMIMH